jgi:hypothetical protein
MKRCVVLIVLLGIFVTGHAQYYRALGAAEENAAIVSPVVQKKNLRIAYEATKPPGLRMRKAGMIMTICGGGLMIAGAIVYSNADPNAGPVHVNQNGQPYTDGEVDQAMGVLGVMAGAGLTIPGLILWSKGGKKYKRYLDTQTAFNFTKNGAGLTYRF